MNRLNDVPPLKVLSATVEARYFNRVRLALVRLGCPLRLQLPALRHLDIVLDRQVWILVDRDLADLPVAAWTEFSASRHTLHVPVPCRLRIYHQHAEQILPTVLSETDARLAERLSAPTGPGRRRKS